MAKGEVDDFLKLFYRRLHAGSMDYDVLARLVDNKKKGILTAEQASWFEDGFFVEDEDSNLKYSAAEEPSLSDKDELHEDELRKLYKRIAKALYGMKSASALYTAKYKHVKDFINKYIDDLKFFPIPKATDECKDAIGVLLETLENHPNKEDIKKRIVETAKTVDSEGKDASVFKGNNAVDSLNKFIREKIIPGKYDEDTTVQNKLKAIASGLYNDWRYSAKDDVVTRAVEQITNSLSLITHESSFQIQDEDIDKSYKQQLNEFEGGEGSNILRKLYYDEDVREKFAEKDSELVDIITKAEGKISYQNPESKDYLKPKNEDTLTPLQQVEKWATDTYKNSIRKYMRLRGDPLLFSGYSKEIFKAIDKKDVKPTDGLNGLLDKAKDIKEKISNKTVMEHFDWFIETMTKIKDEKPKAVADAWNNARQMKTVITEIILKASGPGSSNEDMEKAKTAMEIMTAMKYGMMTSKIMEAMHATDFNIFSDGQLSWNKNEGIQFVTRAFDKSIKFAFEALGLGLTFARNKIMMSGMKFNDKDNKNEALSKNIAWEKNELSKKQSSDRKAKESAIKDAKQKRDDNQDILDDLNASGFDRAEAEEKKIDAESKIAPYKQRMNEAAKRRESSRKNLDKYYEQMISSEQANDEYINAVKIINGDDIRELEAEAEEIKEQIISIQKSLKKPLVDINENPITELVDVNGNPITDVVQGQKTREQLLERLTLQYNDKQNEISRLKGDTKRKDDAKEVRDANKEGHDKYEQAETGYRQAQEDYFSAGSDYENAENEYNAEAQKYDYQETIDKITQFEDATKAIDEANKTIEKKQKDLDNWPKENVNKVKELEDFWNFLQTGRTRTWRLSTEKIQKKFDTDKEQMYADWVAQHGMDM